MGIFGLRKYIRRHFKHKEFMQQLSAYLTADCILIIDAPNLVYKFHEHMGLDSLCGGQYEEFYQGLFEFFTSLRRDCPRLRVLVLLTEVTEVDKLEVVKSRKLNKLKQWVEAIERAEPFSCIPLCAWEVLHEVVRACGVQTLHYDSEADDFMSALALHYTQQGTPSFILSEDTDFYLTVGITGVLSLEDIVWSPGSRTRPVLKESQFFSLNNFMRINYFIPWMIPFLAMLLGNDITPTELKSALEPIKSEYSSQGRGHFFAKIVFYLTRHTQTEQVTLDSIRCKLSPELRGEFERTYTRNKNRYLSPLSNVPPGDVPTPQLERMKRLYHGLSQQSLLRIGCVWNNRVGRTNNASLCAEDYRQPRACLASLALRCYWHGVALMPTQDTGVKPPTHVVEICRQRDATRYEEDMGTLGNVIVDEEIEVFYSVAGRSLPSLSVVQELSQGDKQQIFLSVMHCSACAVLFSDTELINYEVSVILSTLYYWYHQISFREVRSPSKATPLAVLQRQELLRTLVTSALATYFKDQLILPILKAPNLRAVTEHAFYHSVAEWVCIQQDTNILLLLLDLPVVSIRWAYNGRFLFRMITDRGFSIAVSSLLRSLMGAELPNLLQALLTPCSELK